MKILVLSDSHGDSFGVKEILRREPKAEAVIFCGDGLSDIQSAKFDFPEKAFYMVRGNCDFGSDLDLVRTINLAGKKILFAHGHSFYVKSSDYDIKSSARTAGADIVIYGHTHNAFKSYEDELYIMNPGSCHGSFGTYGTIEIRENGILLNIINR